PGRDPPMTARSPDLGATVAGVHLAFCAMNAPEAFSLPHDLRRLVTSRTGAIVLRTATVHPFLHPEFRSLHNPGYDKLVPLVRELVATGGPPVVATIAGASVEEYGFLARAFADAGIHSGYDVRRALAKGAKAVQVRSALVEEGPGVFARLEREMRMARG